MTISDRNLVKARLTVFTNDHLFDPVDEDLAKAYGFYMGYGRAAKLFIVIDKRLEGETAVEYRNRAGIFCPGVLEAKAENGWLYIEHHTESARTCFSAPVEGDDEVYAEVQDGMISIDPWALAPWEEE